jgi:selenocysteine lyase/cysteine desulfurase
MHKDNIDEFRKLFIGLDTKVLVKGKDHMIPINFDNAATTPVFRRVMKKIMETSEYYGSIARGDGQKSIYSSELYDQCRSYVLNYLNAPQKIYTAIFVNNTTDGINRLSNMLIEGKDDIVITTRMEHHSNDLPWRGKCDLKYIEVDELGRIKLDELEQLLIKYNNKVKFVTISGASNVTGYINNIKKVAKLAHEHGANIIVDGAQLVPHKRISMISEDGDENIDFLVFSAHKMYAPFGSGAIVGLKEYFNKCKVDLKGGGTVQAVFDDKEIWLEAPEKNEAGSPNFFGAVAMVEAMKELDKIGFDIIERNEKSLFKELIDGMKSFNRVILYGDNENISDRLGILVFNIIGLSYDEVAEALANTRAIAIRQGGFCAHPYTRRLLGIKADELQDYINKNGMPGMVRASLGIYNSKKEVNIFLETIEYLCRKYKART